MTIDKNQLSQAREWAEAAKFYRGLTDNARAAAEVIRDLPAAIVDGDKMMKQAGQLRDLENAFSRVNPKYVDTLWVHAMAGAIGAHAELLEALLPAPAPQVDIVLGGWAMHPRHGKVLILSEHIDRDGEVCITWEGLESSHSEIGRWVPAADLSPLPSATPSSDHSADPEPQAKDVPGGEPWEVSVGNGQEYVGIRSETGIWELFDREDGHHSRWGLPSDITPLHRLVPEQQPRTNAEMSEDTRMTTVELPNVGDGWYRCRADHLDPFRLKRGTHRILTEREGVLVRAGSDVDFHIADNEIEEFALALLALHHQRTDTQ